MTLCLDCPTCGQRREVEMPRCADGHGAECADRACVACSTGFFVDPILPRGRAERLQRAA